MRIAVVTDSTSDIPHDLAERHHIHVVPNVIVIDGESIEDGKGFSRREFYEKLPQMKQIPTTATASSGTYVSLYEDLFSQGFQSILSIHASRELSGIYNAANAAAETLGSPVKVIDSQQVSMGLGFQVLAAAEAVAEDLPIEAILERLERLRPRVRLIAMLDTLEYVRRSGRVSWAQAGLGSLLKIKLFVEVKDGVVHRAGEVRTRGKGLARLYELLKKLGKPERLAILHTNADESVQEFLTDLDLAEKPLIVNVTTVIGTHVGPNALGFSGVFTRPG
jgi:DegV family protein with EDD domain